MSDEDIVYVRPGVIAEMRNVTERTVRKWLRTGKVPGEMINDVWIVPVERAKLDAAGITYEPVENPNAAHDQPKIVYLDRSRKEPDPAPEQSDRSEPGPDPDGDASLVPVDLEPMQVLIRELTSEIARLSGAAAMYQERAAHLEQRVAQLEEERKALTAGPTSPDPEPAPTVDRPWWKRLLGIE